MYRENIGLYDRQEKQQQNQVYNTSYIGTTKQQNIKLVE